jgi:hypothetical protein
MFHATIVRLTMVAPIPFMAQPNANVPIICRVIAKFIIAVPSRALGKQSAYQTQTIDKNIFIVLEGGPRVGNSRKLVNPPDYLDARASLVYGRKHKRENQKPMSYERPR